VRQLGGIVKEAGKVGDGGAELDDLGSELTVHEGRYVECFNGIEIFWWFRLDGFKETPRGRAPYKDDCFIQAEFETNLS